MSLAFGQRARRAGVAVSMGSRGDCFDNAVAESFFATLKKELVRRRPWPTRRELQSAVFDYIESFYNRERRHSTLGYLSPREFEMILKSAGGKLVPKGVPPAHGTNRWTAAMVRKAYVS